MARTKLRALTVAGLRMAVEVPPDLPWSWPSGPLARFATSPSDADVHIGVRLGVPEAPPANRVRFDSCGGIFDVAIDGREFVIALRIRGELTRVARFDADFRFGEVVVAPDSIYARECAYPLAYPLDEVIFLHRILRDGGLLLHSSGVACGRRGLLFTGPSGAGKTTISRLMQRCAGAHVLSDDRIVLRPDDAGGVRIFGTPWHGEAELSAVGSVRLAAIHAIHHAPAVDAEPLSGAAAATAVLGNAFVPAHDPVGSALALDFAADLIRRVPVTRLGFPMDERVVHHVLASGAFADPGRAIPAVGETMPPLASPSRALPARTRFSRSDGP